MIYTNLRDIYWVFEIMEHNVYTLVPGESNPVENYSHS